MPDTSAKKHSHIKASSTDRIFMIFVYLFLVVSLLLVLFPLIYVVSASFSDSKAVISGEVWLFPVRPTLKGYKAVFENPQIITGFLNSFFYMFAGTAISLFLTVLAAYPLSRQELIGRKFFNGLFLFTMLFSGGMIPSYILLKDLNMLNTRWPSSSLLLFLSGILLSPERIIKIRFPLNCMKPPIWMAAVISNVFSALFCLCQGPFWPSWRCTMR